MTREADLDTYEPGPPDEPAITPVANTPTGAPDVREFLATSDHPDDLSCGCDLGDPHDEMHHNWPANKRCHCNHPECRADDVNDDLKVGLL